MYCEIKPGYDFLRGNPLNFEKNLFKILNFFFFFFLKKKGEITQV
jgi:hypothetical protein